MSVYLLASATWALIFCDFALPHTGYFIAEPLPNAEWNTSLIGRNECRPGSPCRRRHSRGRV